MDYVRKEFYELIRGVKNEEELKQLKAKFLGKKGKITIIFKNLANLSDEEKKASGKKINEVKHIIEEELNKKAKEIASKKKQEALEQDTIDITLPGKKINFGGLHPITKTIKEIESIFFSIGFDIKNGPEVEHDFYNFEMLNIPKEHPARDMQDTFYINDNTLLRTHTSPTQIRIMENSEPPLMFISPGRVYRRDSDITHSPMFHQIEGLFVDEFVKFSDLKGVIIEFLKKFFGYVDVRFRPSYFPFTEPSAEVDIGCIFCGGKGCKVCSYSGFIEVLGCGMVHSNVLFNVGYEKKWSGFAFGLGIERFAMLKYGIDNIKIMFENDMRFLDEFSFSRGKLL